MRKLYKVSKFCDKDKAVYMGKVSKAGHHGSVREIEPGYYEVRVTSGVKRVKRIDGSVVADEGKPRTVRKRFRGSYEDALALGDELWAEMNGDPNVGDRLTLAQYWERVYVPEHLPLRRTGTALGYQSAWVRYIEPAFGDMWPPEISYRMLQRWVNTIESSANQRKMMRVLRAIVRRMRDDLAIQEDIPMLYARVEFKPLQRHRSDTWGADEVLEAMDRLRGHRIERLFLIMAGGGLRKEEAMPLICPTDFHFEKDAGGEDLCLVKITKTWTDADGVSDLTKVYKDRAVAIGEPFAGRLKELMPRDGNEPVFVSSRPRNPHGKSPVLEGCSLPSVTPGSVGKAWQTLFKEGKEPPYPQPAGPLHGMRYIKFEALRNTHVTMARRGGATPELSALAHGHTRQVAEQYYVGAEDAAHETAAAVRDHLLNKGARKE